MTTPTPETLNALYEDREARLAFSEALHDEWKRTQPTMKQYAEGTPIIHFEAWVILRLMVAEKRPEAAEKIQEKVGPSDAPCHYGNEDAFAWVAGWNSARDAFRAALAGEEKP